MPARHSEPKVLFFLGPGLLRRGQAKVEGGAVGRRLVTSGTAVKLLVQHWRRKSLQTHQPCQLLTELDTSERKLAPACNSGQQHAKYCVKCIDMSTNSYLNVTSVGEAPNHTSVSYI